MMIGMCVVGLSAVGIPLGHSAPILARILGEMQVDAATEDTVRIGWMDGNAIAIGHLLLLGKMHSANVIPTGTSILRPKNAEYPLPVIRRDRAHDVGIRWRQSDAC